MNDFDSIKRGMASATIRGLALAAALAAAAPAAGQLFDAMSAHRRGEHPARSQTLNLDGAPDLAVGDRVSVLFGEEMDSPPVSCIAR